jgi:elongation factor G
LVKGQDSKAAGTVIRADVPLSEMFGYVTHLRTITSGRATSTMEFSHYEEAPSGISKEIIEKATGEVTVD